MDLLSFITQFKAPLACITLALMELIGIEWFIHRMKPSTGIPRDLFSAVFIRIIPYGGIGIYGILLPILGITASH